jgi:hypothetical protein
MMIPDKKKTSGASILKKTKGLPQKLPSIEDNRSAITLIEKEELNIVVEHRFKIPSEEFNSKRRKDEFMRPFSEHAISTFHVETLEKIQVIPVIAETP